MAENTEESKLEALAAKAKERKEAKEAEASILEYNKAQRDELKQQTILLREQDTLLKQANFSYDKRVKVSNQIVENEIRIMELGAKFAENQAEMVSVFSYLNEELGNISSSLEDQAGSFGNMIKAAGKFAEARRMKQKLENSLSDDQKKKITDIIKLEENLAKERKKGDKANKEELEKAEEALDVAMGALSTEEKITLELHKQGKIMAKQAAITAPAQLAKAARGLADTMAEPINAYSAVSAEVNRLTNGNTALMDSIQSTFQQNEDLWKMGITHEKLAVSMAALEQRSLDFKNASKQVQDSIGITAAKLDSLGVSSDASGELFNIMTKNFGQSAGEFEGFATQMLADSKSIGVNIEKYTSDFQASFPVLSKYGKGATDVFHRLAAQSRKTGLSVQELTSAMGQFDTFEGAAENASKLNMLLGSQLDTTRLLAADESERIEMIKSQFSGDQFKKMDRFRKKAIAAAAGFSDVGTFEKAMSGGELGELGDRAEAANVRLAEAAERATNTTDSSAAALANMNTQVMFAATNFSLIKDNLHEAGIFVNHTGNIIDVLGKVAGFASGALGILASIVTMSAAALGALTTPILIFGAKVLAVTLALGALAVGAYKLFKWIMGPNKEDEEEKKIQQQPQSNAGAISNPIASVIPGATANIPKINMTGAKSTTKSTTKNTSDNTSITSIQNNVAVPNSTQDTEANLQKQIELTEHALNEAREQNRLTREMLTHIRTAYKPHQTTMQSA